MTIRRKIVLFVWGVHLLVVCMLLVNHFWTYRKKISQPMVVRTVAPAAEEKPVETKLAAKPQPKSTPKPKPTPRPKSAKTKSAPSAALRHVKEALAALDTLQQTSSVPPALSIPAQVQFAKSSETSQAQQTYGTYIAAFLEKELVLPEYGEVKMELQIDRLGQVVQLDLVASENTQNTEFLKNRLPELTFPCFNEFDIDANRLTFTISFCNAHL